MGNKTTLTALACLALVAGAHADITIVEGGSLVTFENIQFNTPGLLLSGPVVEGEGNVSGSIVEFFDANEDLQAVAAGAARVTAIDGSFAFLSLQMQDPLMAFVDLQFNLVALTDGDVTITAHSNKGGTTTETFAISKKRKQRLLGCFHYAGPYLARRDRIHCRDSGHPPNPFQRCADRS